MNLISNNYISTSAIYSGDYIAHHGIKGQKWGVRRFQNEDGSLTSAGEKRYLRKTDRTAKKDAKEYVRAKMYYGEGAGTRRKLINKTVEQRRKDSVYSERFDYYVGRQDMAKAASKARTERHVRDVATGTRKTARGIVNLATGTGAKVGASAVAIYGIARMTGLDRLAIDTGRAFISKYIR